MRITKTHVQRLAAEIEERTGTNPVGTISSPGDGRTHYMMQESMTSTYYGARAAAAYLLGILTGIDPDGPVHWTETMPEWVRDIDTEFTFGEIGKASVEAYAAGRAYGRTHR